MSVLCLDHRLPYVACNDNCRHSHLVKVLRTWLNIHPQMSHLGLLSPTTQGLFINKRLESIKIQNIELTALKCCLQNLTWSLYTWTHSIYNYQQRTLIKSSLAVLFWLLGLLGGNGIKFHKFLFKNLTCNLLNFCLDFTNKQNVTCFKNITTWLVQALCLPF